MSIMDVCLITSNERAIDLRSVEELHDGALDVWHRDLALLVLLREVQRAATDGQHAARVARRCGHCKEDQMEWETDMRMDE